MGHVFHSLAQGLTEFGEVGTSGKPRSRRQLRAFVVGVYKKYPDHYADYWINQGRLDPSALPTSVTSLLRDLGQEPWSSMPSARQRPRKHGSPRIAARTRSILPDLAQYHNGCSVREANRALLASTGDVMHGRSSAQGYTQASQSCMQQQAQVRLMERLSTNLFLSPSLLGTIEGEPRTPSGLALCAVAVGLASRRCSVAVRQVFAKAELCAPSFLLRTLGSACGSVTIREPMPVYCGAPHSLAKGG